MLTDSLFVSQYFSSAFSFVWSPFSDSDKISMSSAHRRQLILFSVSILTFSLPLSKIGGKSARKMLKSRGLSTQPCLTPLFVLNDGEC